MKGMVAYSVMIRLVAYSVMDGLEARRSVKGASGEDFGVTGLELGREHCICEAHARGNDYVIAIAIAVGPRIPVSARPRQRLRRQ